MLGELAGVGEQVPDDLLKTLLVGPDLDGQHRIDVDGEAETTAFGDVPEVALDEVAEVVQPHRLVLQRDRARLDLGEVEDVVYQVQEVGARGQDDARELDLLRRQVAVRVVAQLLGQDHQAVQRRSQLVRHVGQELGLELAGDGELGGLLFQRRLCLLDLEVLALDLAVLLRQQLGLLLQLVVGVPELLLLALQLLSQRL